MPCPPDPRPDGPVPWQAMASEVASRWPGSAASSRWRGLHRWRQALADAWPGLCPICGQWTQGCRCADCWQRFLPPLPRCPGCGRAVSAGVALCGHCLQHGRLAERVVVALDYGFPWAGLVSGLKFHQRLDLTPWLARLLLDELHRQAGSLPAVTLVLPVPLAPERLRERGYNQAGQISHWLAKRLNLPHQPQGLLRWRAVARQTGLGRAERLRNLLGAFMPAPGRAGQLRGQHVALVDDVLTTGATLSAASAALHEAGVASVQWWVVARTPEGGAKPRQSDDVSHRSGSP